MNAQLLSGGLMFTGGMILLLSLPALGMDRRVVIVIRLVLVALVALLFVFGVQV